ncbi:MAG: helix-turn-helix domain-containing protein [Spirochaetes bacterium]|nr:helix-turn-helix domain-containing protein [Spirochaetota bacterium]
MDLMHLAHVMKTARLGQRLTVEALAKRAGVSKAFISRLENFRVAPSLATLHAISTALGIPMKDFFEKESVPPPILFGRLEEGRPVDRDDAGRFGMTYLAQAWEKIDRGMHPFLVTYEPASKTRELLAHDSEEFFLLLEGQVDFLAYDESNPRRMRSGDTAYLSRGLPHAVRLPAGVRSAKALVVYRLSDLPPGEIKPPAKNPTRSSKRSRKRPA